MAFDLYLGFLIVSAIIISVPGPNVTLILATAAGQGVRAGLLTVAGTTAAQMVQVAIVAAGLVWLLESYGAVFDMVRLIGAAYLVYLGFQAWRAAAKPLPQIAKAQDNVLKGFLMGLANPKSLTFFATFFPQFINPAGPQAAQFAQLCASYLVLVVLFDSAYAVAAGKGRRLLASGRGKLYLGRSAGLVLIGGGLWLASLRRG